MKNKKEVKLKSLRVELIPDSKSCYKLLRYAIDKWHLDLLKAKIALAWVKKVKPDKDGILLLGKCHKMTDLERELRHYDFVILLNKEVWTDDKFDKKRKLALLDHELCHATKSIGKDGHQKRDEKKRRVWRTRKHEIEEFREIVERHGCYKRDLELFAEAILKRKHH